jgi:hypothetical protein
MYVLYAHCSYNYMCGYCSMYVCLQEFIFDAIILQSRKSDRIVAFGRLTFADKHVIRGHGQPLRS